MQFVPGMHGAHLGFVALLYTDVQSESHAYPSSTPTAQNEGDDELGTLVG